MDCILGISLSLPVFNYYDEILEIINLQRGKGTWIWKFAMGRMARLPWLGSATLREKCVAEQKTGREEGRGTGPSRA